MSLIWAVNSCASGATAARYARLTSESPGTLLEDLIDFQPEFC